MSRFDDVKPITYVALDSKLFQDVKACCEESGHDVEEIVNGAVGCALNGYLEGRNNTLAKYSNEAIKEVYPGMTDEQCETVRSMAKNGSLGIIRPITNDDMPEGSFYSDAAHFDVYQGPVYMGLGPNAVKGTIVDGRFVPDEEQDKVPVATEIKDKELLRTLKDVINTAHQVNVKIEIIQK